MMKLLALTVTFIAAAAWIVLLVWQSLMICEAWRDNDLYLDDFATIAFPLVGLAVTVAVGWRAYPHSVPAALLGASSSLALALFCLAVVSAVGGAQIGIDFATCASSGPA